MPVGETEIELWTGAGPPASTPTLVEDEEAIAELYQDPNAKQLNGQITQSKGEVEVRRNFLQPRET